MRASRRSVAASIVIAASLVPVAFAPPVAARSLRREITDPALVAAIESTSGRATRVPVEVVTHDTDRARTAVIALGGTVVGSVPGEVLQASLPAGALERLADHAFVDSVRRPLTANRPVTDAVEFGPVMGQNVNIVNASAWHAAGITGAGVKVGIIDFFDLSLWTPAENGPVPDSAHRFCLDSSGAGYCPSTGAPGEEHGVAIAEVLRDMAPDAELYLATAGTASDLMAAIDWFAANGVRIVTRSLGAAYDGPGDGTGPLAAVVDHATALGITWFNSAGNDAAGGYGRFSDGTDGTGYVDFLPGPGYDPDLRVLPTPVSPGVNAWCFGLDGIRWSDWGLPAAQITDYELEVYLDGNLFETVSTRYDDSKPLLGQDYYLGCTSHTVSVRLRRIGGGDSRGDVIEVGLFTGELARSSVGYSAAKPVVDSRSPALVAVGAIDPAAGTSVGFYSSQGPTNDGRIKPDVTAPSCVASSIYVPCFSGTSAASPSAAGMAALLYERGLAAGGAHLAALVKHLVTDLGPAGPDNAFGAGRITLPPPPPDAIDSSPAQYTPTTPTRILDTRPASATPGARIGPHPQFTVIDLPVGVAGATAAVVSIVSTDSVAPGYVQALPTLMGGLGTSSTLNVASSSQVQPNLAVVPIGANGSITLYLFAGGNVVVDLLGTFAPAATPAVSAGRLVALDPVRVLDTRPESHGPVPPEFAPHTPQPGETVRVTGIPAGATAAIVNVAADQAVASGFVRTQPTGAGGLATSNGNFVAGVASGTLSIVPVGPDGTISVYTSQQTHLVVDLMGYITGPSAPASAAGLFVPLAPFRQYDSRVSDAGLHPSLGRRLVQMTGAAIPAGAIAVSMNLTADAADGAGFLSVFPAGQALPTISNLNYPTFDPRANAGVVKLSSSGTLDTLVNRTTHVIIDVNGYFTGPT
ncbi:MAG: S8 family serine peptidase [Actinobacteria bacterium]|nr:S8 family serine peptidase [Actinomycetota bacterium]